MNVFLNFVVFVVINGFIATKVNVDMAGHIGGFLAGLLLATFHFKFHMVHPGKISGAVIGAVGQYVAVVAKRPGPLLSDFSKVLKTDDRINNFYAGIRAMEKIRDSLAVILPIWDSISSSLARLKKVPPQLAADTAILKDYVHLRRQGTFYRIRLIERQSYIYLDSLEILDGSFSSLPPLKYVLNFKPKDPEPVPADTATAKKPLLYPCESLL